MQFPEKILRDCYMNTGNDRNKNKKEIFIMKKRNVARIMAVLMATVVCFSFAACGSKDSDDASKDAEVENTQESDDKAAAVSNDVWKYDTTFGTAQYVNNHKYFAKFDDSTGAVYVYSTKSDDPTALTCFAVFNVSYTDNGDGSIDCSVNSGFIRAMNGDNPIESEVTSDSAATWWTNMVGETMTLILGEDGTLDVKMAD